MTDDRPVGSRRLDALDAARGVAMLGVCASHFGDSILRREPGLGTFLKVTSMFASPAFILVSGCLAGYLLANRRDDLAGLRIRLTDRGLFLLTMAHVITALAYYLTGRHFGDAVAKDYLTDAIGVSLIAGAAIVPRTSARTRLAIAGVLYVVGWTIVLNWHPSGNLMGRSKGILIGDEELSSERADFPVVLWFAVYLLGTTLGTRLAAQRTSAAREALGRRLLWVGPAAIAVAFVVKGAYWLVRPVAWPDGESMPVRWREAYDLTTPFFKFPPGPTYLLAYGGIALVLLGGLLVAVERGWWTRLAGAFAVVGRASLFVFLAQWYVYLLLVPLLPVKSHLMQIPYFALTVAVLWIAAWAWGRVGGNRFITVGLRSFAERRHGLAARSAGAVAVKVEVA